MAAPYSARFKMLTVALYDGSTNVDEHLENFQSICSFIMQMKAFYMTLIGTTGQWYQRLMLGMMDLFK